MNDSEVGRRVREQVSRFSGIFSPRFSVPQGHFIEQMIFGIQAAQDVKLSNIGRALGESIELKKTEERLSHHLASVGMGQVVNEVVAQDAAARGCQSWRAGTATERGLALNVLSERRRP